jgi:hypothetical protein
LLYAKIIFGFLRTIEILLLYFQSRSLAKMRRRVQGPKVCPKGTKHSTRRSARGNQATHEMQFVITSGASVPSGQAFIAPKYDDQPSDPISAEKGPWYNHNEPYPVIVRSEVDFEVSCTNRLACVSKTAHIRSNAPSLHSASA